MKNRIHSIIRFGIRSPREWLVIIRLSLANLRRNKIRTALTVLGIVIGVMAVIVVMAGGTAVKNYVLGQVDVFGTDYIQVEVKVPGASVTSSANISGRSTGLAITTLKEEDAEEVARLPNIKAWSALNIDQELVAYKQINKRALIIGTNPAYQQIDRQLEVVAGDFFDDSDEESARQVVVIGSGIRDSFFGQENPIGKNIKIKGQSYRVVGLLKERGSAGFLSFDDFMFVPLKTLNSKLLGVDYVQQITFKVRDVTLIEETALDVRDVMRDQHDITDPDKEDFSVTTAVEAREIISSVFVTINYLLLALTSISLLVGGVGIMNVMYVAVTERTREIGLRKAVGARNSSILRQFLFEAVVVTFLGGLMGIIIGIALTYVLSSTLTKFGYEFAFVIPLQSIAIAASFSIVTGVIFGIYPAWKASQLSPIEALRK